MIALLGAALLTAIGCFVTQPEAVSLASTADQKPSVLTEGCESIIQGKVKGRVERPEDLNDGEFALKVSTADYGMVTVVYSAFRLCHNDVGASLKAGDKIEVYGKVISKNKITVCLSKNHYIKKL
ncbi:MAG: hypothetical protein ACR2H6_07605 [Pyrinomonadaceae bacterium]